MFRLLGSVFSVLRSQNQNVHSEGIVGRCHINSYIQTPTILLCTSLYQLARDVGTIILSLARYGVGHLLALAQFIPVAYRIL